MREGTIRFLRGNWDAAMNPTSRKGGEKWGIPVYSFFQVDVLDLFDGTGQKAGAEATEFLYRVRGEKLQARLRTSLALLRGRGHQLRQMRCDGVGCRFG